MTRSLWRGSLSFGLIYVPVELYSATRDNSLPLHMLDSRDFSPVGYQRINKLNGREVDWAHIVKGYEYKKGEYVALSDADFKHANIKASETIAIEAFCDAAAVHPKYYDTPYQLAPGKGGEKVYALLRQALAATKTLAVGTFVMRGRQHLCAVMTDGEALMLITLRFADEILPPVTVKAANRSAIAAAELAMAKKLVTDMSMAFAPAHFKDTYRADLKRRIQEKIRRKQTHVLEAVEGAAQDRPKAQVIDLMAALKASLRRGSMPRGRRAKPPVRKRLRSD